MKLFLCLFGFLSLAALHGQVMGNYQTQNARAIVNHQPAFRAVQRHAALSGDPSVIEFTINALSNQPADAYVAIFSIFQTVQNEQAGNAGEAIRSLNQTMNERVDAVKARLQALGIAEEDVYVDLVNFLPTYAFSAEKKLFSKKTLTEVPTGFNLQKNLHVRYRKAGLLDGIMTACAEEEIYDIIKVDYMVSQPQAIYQELREMTFGYVKELKRLYTANGVNLDSAKQHVGESAWVVNPTDRYETYSAHASQKLTADEKSAAIITQIEKPSLRFYQAIPANDYDMVLNPDLLEPAAQYSYSLKIRFTIQPPKAPAKPEVITKTEIKKQFYYLAADGKMVPLVLE